MTGRPSRARRPVRDLLSTHPPTGSFRAELPLVAPGLGHCARCDEPDCEGRPLAHEPALDPPFLPGRSHRAERVDARTCRRSVWAHAG